MIRSEYNAPTQAINIFYEDHECVLIPDTCSDIEVRAAIEVIRCRSEYEWNQTGGHDCEEWKGSEAFSTLVDAARDARLEVVERSSPKHYLNRHS